MTNEEAKKLYESQTVSMEKMTELDNLVAKGVLTATGVSSDRLAYAQQRRDYVAHHFASEKDCIDAYFKENQ